MTPPITVFYDGACSLCVQQRNFYCVRDKNHAINWADIAGADFRAAEHDLDPQLIQKYMYARDASGQTVRGVETFVWLWQICGYRFLPALFSLPIISHIARAFYRIISLLRYRLGPKAHCPACAQHRL